MKNRCIGALTISVYVCREKLRHNSAKKPLAKKPPTPCGASKVGSPKNSGKPGIPVSACNAIRNPFSFGERRVLHPGNASVARSVEYQTNLLELL
jgi:hypothetical protein